MQQRSQASGKAALIVMMGVCGCMWSASATTRPRLDKRVDESSGLVAGRRFPDVLWTHGDSGTPAELFAVTREGRLIGRVEVQGQGNRDWEDIAADDAGGLWLADTGNNDNDRRDLVVVRVDEPDPRSSRAARPTQVVHLRYPDQDAWPDADELNFDGEALFWADGTLYLLTKHRSDMDTTLYRFPALRGEVLLERVSSYTVGGDAKRFGGMVTGADLSADGQTLAVLTYHALLLFGRPSEGSDWLSRPLKQVPLNQDELGQCEAVAWDGGGLWIGNEKGYLFRLDDPLGWTGVFPAIE